MSMSYFLKYDEKIFKAEGEGKGDMGLLNFQTNDTVFYVGGPPDSFQVSKGGPSAAIVRLHSLLQKNGMLQHGAESPE